jgi:hypothetical protein
MNIRAAQITALTEARKLAFLHRLRTFIEGHVHQNPEDTVLVDLFDRASRYGLITEQQFAGYIVLAWQLGVRPPASDPAWLAEVMNDPSRLLDDKIETLFRRADSKLESRP